MGLIDNVFTTGPIFRFSTFIFLQAGSFPVPSDFLRLLTFKLKSAVGVDDGVIRESPNNLELSKKLSPSTPECNKIQSIISIGLTSIEDAQLPALVILLRLISFSLTPTNDFLGPLANIALSNGAIPLIC
jgi:hypothetical protein